MLTHEHVQITVEEPIEGIEGERPYPYLEQGTRVDNLKRATPFVKRH